jgi:outer membrane protein TolC
MRLLDAQIRLAEMENRVDDVIALLEQRVENTEMQVRGLERLVEAGRLPRHELDTHRLALERAKAHLERWREAQRQIHLGQRQLPGTIGVEKPPRWSPDDRDD